MKFIYDTGGREKYFKGQAGDCVTRAIAIASNRDYREVYNELSEMLGKGNSPRDGVPKKIIKKYLEQKNNWKWKACMGIGTGCKVHLKEDELPSGVIICSLSKHLATVINGELHDTYDCTRNGTRCVYGYWYKEL